jgi:hypothetical protein
MAEIFYQDDNDIEVTDEWVKFGDTFWPLDDIRQASLAVRLKRRYRRPGWAQALLMGLIIANIPFVLNPVFHFLPGFLSGYGTLLFLLFLAYFVFVEAWLWAQAERTFAVDLKGKFKSVDAFVSDDRAYVIDIIDAISVAKDQTRGLATAHQRGH